MSLSFRSFAMLCSVVVLTSISNWGHAQAVRTWVSGVGDDVNPCSRTAPCKTFAGAISKTAAGGEINVIDNGSFGAVTITKAITIDGGGAFAAVLATLGSSGITINAGVNDVVVLRNLNINGIGTGANGIRYLAGKEVNIENCRIQGFASHGIQVSKTTDGRLAVRDTIISKCNTTGIIVSTTVGTIFCTMNDLAINGCATGINSSNGSRVALKNCDFALCTDGLIVQHTTLNARAEVDTCKFTYCNNSIQSGPGANSVVRLTNNLMNNNTLALFGNGGQFFSAQNNVLMGNTSDGAAPTIVLPK